MEIVRRIGIMSLLCTALVLRLQAQQKTVGSQNESSGPASTGEEPIPPAVMKELEAMKKRIEQLEAELSKRDAHQPPTQLVEETAGGPGVPDTRIASAAFVQPQGESTTSATTTPEKPQKAEPFAFADWTWLNGTPRTKTPAFDSKFFTPEIRADVDYIYDFRQPKDDTISGSSEVFRANEIQVTQLGVGGDFHYDDVRARLMTQFGMYSTTTPRNDASPSRGQWNLADAYRYLTEAYGGYHFNALHGNQCGCWNLRLLHRPLQLLQLR